jgi:hypothetical protein
MMRWCEDNEIKQSARDLSWCWPVEDVLADKNFYLRLVMQYGGKEDFSLVYKYFTTARLHRGHRDGAARVLFCRSMARVAKTSWTTQEKNAGAFC